MFQPFSRFIFGVCLFGVGCAQSHTALVRSAALPPPPEPVVRHSATLWVDLFPTVNPNECVTPKENRTLCFADVDRALANALERTLWPSFPRVILLGRYDSPAPLDYVLKLELALDALPPSSGGPGWAALAKGRWQLLRGGAALASESVESRSRADFAYGHALGDGASEVVAAIATHIAENVGQVAETHPDEPRPLPEVVASPLRSVHALVASTSH